MENQKQEIPNLQDQVYSREEYAKASFWDDRYAEKGGFFDWYAQYPELSPVFAEYGIDFTDRVLMVGCGNSKLSYQMYQAGFKDIINIDISPSVIEQMKKQFPQLVWQVMDATKMSYPDKYFDCVIDKGTLDALISGKNFDICQSMLRECMRVTKEEGQLIQITYGSPQGRRKIFQNALSFKDYDYYQCRAELNDMSTLINLMRSNLPGQSLRSIISQKQALAKTMRQYTLIKMMRKSRRNQKKYIVWNNHQQQNIQINPNHPQQVSKQSQIAQNVSNDTESKLQYKYQSNKQTLEPKIQQKPKQQSFNYKPQKQPYVFVYSIRRKFTIGLDSLLPADSTEQLKKQFWNEQTQRYQIAGHPQLCKLTVQINQDYLIQALKAIKFLKTKGAPSSEVLLTHKNQQYLKGSLKIRILPTVNTNKWLTLRKTKAIISLKLSPKAPLEYVLTQLKNISFYLTNKCSLHPCPKTYALLHVLNNRKYAKSVNELMQRYWFPTYQLILANQEQVTIKLSLPPVTIAKQQQIIQTFIEKLAPATVKVLKLTKGYINYLNLELLNITSMACLSYSGSKMQLILQEFCNEEEHQVQLETDKFYQEVLYNEIPHTIAVSSSIVTQLLAHLLAFY